MTTPINVASGRAAILDPIHLSVRDGALFPTSIGANPQLSIYGITARLASGLAQALTGNRPRASWPKR